MNVYNFKRSFFIIGTFLSLQSFGQCVGAGNQNGQLGSGGFDKLPLPIKNFIEWAVKAVTALDPNDIAGPKGYAQQQWVSIKDKMPFTIRFENNAQFATAPAQNVFIHLPIDPKIDINSFRLSSFGFGQYNYTVPENTAYYNTRLDLQDSLGIYVDVIAGVDIIKNEAFWTLRSIDHATGNAPTDAVRGFLPVNDTMTNMVTDTLPGKGEGYVSFTIAPQSGLATGDTVLAKATIIFDSNEEIPTNIWVNTIDAIAPVSRINNHAVTKNTITLQWTGQDDAKGTGVRDYALYVSEDGGVYKLNQTKIAANTIDYIGTPGSTYRFFTLATDNTGNQETLKKGGDLAIELNGIDVALPVTWLYFTGTQQKNDALLQWATTSEKNTKEFVIERALDNKQFKAIGTIQASNSGNQTSNYNYLDIDAMSLESKNLYYRLKQVDKDGKFIYSAIVTLPIKPALFQANVNAYPNPFDRQITLQIKTIRQTDQTDKVELYFLDGKLLYQRKLKQVGNATILLTDLPNLPQGFYTLHVSVAKHLYTIKLTKR